MDIGVYPVKELSNEKLKQLIKDRASFVVTDIDVLNFSEAVETVEKAIESNDLRCRVYTKGRSAAIAGAVVPLPPAVLAGWASAIAIGVHNVATWNPDYEIAKNMATGSLTVNYKK